MQGRRWRTTGIAFAVLTAACGGQSPAGGPTPTGRSTVTPATMPTPGSGVAVTRLADAEVFGPAGDHSYVNPGAVTLVDGVIHAFANSFTAYPGDSVVTHLSSEDGVTWSPHSDPVLTSDDVPFAQGTVFLWSVDVSADGSWVGWFHTYRGQRNEGVIGRATAPAPEGPWTVDPDPLLVPGEGWDGHRVAEPSVVRDGDGYLMAYTGIDADQVAAIGLARSPDGVSWQRVGTGPAFTGGAAWDGGTVDGPRLVPHDDRLGLVYATGRRGVGSAGFATSTDGTRFTALADVPILTRDDTGDQIWQQAVVPTDDGLLWLVELGPGSTATTVHAYRLAP